MRGEAITSARKRVNEIEELLRGFICTRMGQKALETQENYDDNEKNDYRT